MSNSVPEVSVDYFGLDEKIEDELCRFPYERISDYFLELEAEASEYTDLSDFEARLTFGVEDHVHGDRDRNEFTVNVPEYFEIQGLQEADAFEALDSAKDDEIANVWKMVHRPESESLLELVEEVEGSGPIWMLEFRHDRVKSCITYDPVDDAFKVEGPFTSAENREVTDSHPAYATADRNLREAGLDSFSD